MNSNRTNPLIGLGSFVKDIQSMMGEFEKSVEVETSTFKPRVDILQNETTYILVMDLPGVNKSDVNIKINDENVLTISGNKIKPEFSDKDTIRTERIYGNFERSFNMADDADTEKITAKFDSGTLTVEVAKKEKIEPKNIEITIQ